MIIALVDRKTKVPLYFCGYDIEAKSYCRWSKYYLDAAQMSKEHAEKLYHYLILHYFDRDKYFLEVF